MIERSAFYERTVKDETTGCWLWPGDPLEYGKTSVDGKSVAVHRFSYEISVGKIPDGLVIDHLCRNVKCVNPAHLEAVTNKENVLRGIGPTALNAQKDMCPNGHEYTAENTRVCINGKRNCRECTRARYHDNKSRWYATPRKHRPPTSPSA